MSISFVTPNLAVSGRLSNQDLGLLRSAGITHILNVNWPDEPEPREIQAGFICLDLTLMDDGQPKPAAWFEAGIDFSKTLGASDKLLVHCGHGINRSPAMAYAILRSQGVVNPEAVLRKGRPQTGSGSTGAWFEVYRKSADEALSHADH